MISHSLAKRHLAVLVVLLLCSSCSSPRTAKDAITLAFEQQRSNIEVEGEGIVVRTLSDDTSGVPHQRFIVRIASGSTVLVSHNTHVAERIDDLKTGDHVGFAGEYIWNPQGGVLHWTHHDPDGPPYARVDQTQRKNISVRRIVRRKTELMQSDVHHYYERRRYDTTP